MNPYRESNKMSNTFNPRMRGHAPMSRFSDQARAAKAAAARTQFKRPEGQFDRLVLNDIPIWMRLAPEQLYKQMIYNRAKKEVEEVERQWYEFLQHFVPSRQQPFICSAGANHDQPCRGCSVRALYYKHISEQEQNTGVRNEEARKSAPIQASPRFGMAVTVLEKIFSLPAMKNGKPRTSKNGDVIMNKVPAPHSGVDRTQWASTKGEQGHNYHWSFSGTHLAQLGDIDATLWNYCASCRSELMATQFVCAECGEVVYEDTNGVVGPDLGAVRKSPMRCPHCQHEGTTYPLISCTGCDKPAEGSLFAFDLQLRAVPIGDKKTDLKLENFRLPDYTKLFGSNADRITELVYNPLDIVAIFAPDSLESQGGKLPDTLKAMGAEGHLKEKSSKPYGTDDDSGDGGDADQMQFDNS